eukprot:202692_1
MPQIQQMQQQQYYAMPQYQMYQQQQAMQQQNAMVVDEYNARQQVKGHDNQMQQQYNSNTIISHINYDMQQPNEETECNISPLMRWCIDNKFETYHDTLFYLCQLESPHEFKDLKENDLNDIAEQYLGLKFAKKISLSKPLKIMLKCIHFNNHNKHNIINMLHLNHKMITVAIIITMNIEIISFLMQIQIHVVIITVVTIMDIIRKIRDIIRQ